MTSPIRPFERQSLVTVAPAAERSMTDSEVRLNTFAGRFPDAVFVWHRGADGQFVGLHTITSDGIRIGVQTYHEGE